MKEHPWRDWAGASGVADRMPGAQSRWRAGKNLSWEPLRVERVCEVKYDHIAGRSVSPCHAVPSLATGPSAAGLSL